MGEIKSKVTVEGAYKSEEMEALFDSGSTFGHLDEDIAEDLGFVILPIEYDANIAGGMQMKVKPAVGYMTVNGCRRPVIIGVSEKGAVPLSIGLAQMQLMGIKLDPQKETFSVKCTVPKV